MFSRRTVDNGGRFYLAAVAALIVVAMFATETVAAPPGPHKRHLMKPGHHIKVLPKGSTKFFFGGLIYYHLNGSYYKGVPSGYVVVSAPVGAIVQTLPLGAVVIRAGAVTYYTHSGVYYQQTPDGYLIVNPSEVRPSEIVAGDGGLVRVTASQLNVRSGPGKQNPVINQVRKGDVLEIQAVGSGWYYVKLPDGSYGWVIIEYTTRLRPKVVG